MIALFTAVAHEAALLRSKLNNSKQLRINQIPCTTGHLSGIPVILASLGMGPLRSQTHALQLLSHFNVKGIVLAGYAGALNPNLKHGDVTCLLPETYSHWKTELQHALPNLYFAKGVEATSVIASSKEKKWLHETSRADVVDMETSAVQSVATAQGLPFIAFRAISDVAQDELPSGALAASCDPDTDRPTVGRLLFHLASHPGDMIPFVRFVSGLGSTRKNLTHAVAQALPIVNSHMERDV